MHFFTLLLFLLQLAHAAPYPTYTCTQEITNTSAIAVSSTLLTISTSTSAIAVTSTLALSTPTPTPTPTSIASLPAPTAGVYICTLANFTGACTHHLSPASSAPSACVQLDGTASSVGPDKGFECTFFTNAFCDRVLSDGSDAFSVGWPGYKDLKVLGRQWDDGVRSYYCLGEGRREVGKRDVGLLEKSVQRRWGRTCIVFIVRHVTDHSSVRLFVARCTYNANRLLNSPFST
ncbi:hypothetical protein HBI55_119690 [Parastagonospora nodorum]|nr:hypothetical protein HBI55_119690 [Parastagonospora nodorum]